MVRRQHQKGQGFTEFALILPLLLLLLLGVIEAGRVIWAYITVQNAAREATRYAVTGRPYLDSNISIGSQENVCTGEATEPDPISSLGIQPWLCEPDKRVDAIKGVAISHLSQLAWSDICGDEPNPEDAIAEYFGPCALQPGAIGVLVEGQVTIETVTGTLVVSPTPVLDHPGQQGLNIQVSTFYNLQMLTPIFDAIMGGTYIPLRGVVQLQNEGLDAASGIEPPPGINPPPPPASGGSGSIIETARIWSVSGYDDIKQSDILRVHLENHPITDKYNIYLTGDGGTYLICGHPTDGNQGIASAAGGVDTDCPLGPHNIPPGLYTLYSTVSPTSDPRIATDPQEIEIVSGGDPYLEVEGGPMWAAREKTEIILRFHDLAKGPYTIKLFDGGGTPLPATYDMSGSGLSTEPVAWNVPDLDDIGMTICSYASGNYCTLKSYDKDGVETASLPVQVNQPQIVLSPAPTLNPVPGVYPYQRGQLIYIYLRGHTPGQRYNITVNPTNITPPDVPPQPFIEDTVEANSVGDTTLPIFWAIPESCGLGTGWPDGLYEIFSKPLEDSTSVAIAEIKDIEISGPTPNNPSLTIEGGNTWAAGSNINIRVHQHLPNHTYYLEFDGNRIPTDKVDDTFMTGTCGSAIINFQIPATKPAGTYTIRSVDNDNDNQQASVDINVIAKPIIEVEEGETVLPDQVINVNLFSHQPNTSYDIFYAERRIQSILTKDDGTWSFTYDLKNLPNSPYVINYGVPYTMASYSAISGTTPVATTTLTLRSADLVVTQVDVAPSAELSATVPITVHVRNTQPVPIDRFVDIDLYFMHHPDPDPIGPSYLAGYNFPGDIKYWKSSIGPNEIFIITHTIQADELGLNTIYGYADTSNYVFESESVGEVANPNNLNNSAMLVSCPGGLFTETFSTDYAQGDPIPGWNVTTYGNGSAVGFETQVTGGQLLLNSSGSGEYVTNDNDAGHLYFYRSTPIPSAPGLDVQVKVTDIVIEGNRSRAGISIRNSLDPSSPTINLVVSRKPSTSNFYIEASRRDGGGRTAVGGSVNWWRNNHTLGNSPSDANPVWLRLERVAGGGGAFNIYYRQSSTPPPPLNADAATKAAYWGSPVQSDTLAGIGDNVYIGLINVPYDNNDAGTGQLDEFSYFPDSSSCPDTGGQDPFPPGLQVCTEMLTDGSFEGPFPGVWGTISNNGVSLNSTGGFAGNNSLRVTSFDSFPTTPAFWQQFTMPSWVISTTTTFDVNFQHRIFKRTTNEPDDKLYALVATTNNPATWTQLTTPTLVAEGVEPANPSQWKPKTIRLEAAPGINLEDYAGQKLYLYFYDNTNDNPPAGCQDGGTTCATDFHFDVMSLQTCTTQPKPSPITTRITGRVTLHFSNGTVSNLPGVKVWAYAQDNQNVYETFSIQDGEYNFYNLPPGEYTIFAQYVLASGDAEILAADTSILLKSTNDDTNPARAFLSLFTLQDLP